MDIYPPNLHYRKRADVPAKILSSVEGYMNIYRINIQKLLKSFNVPFTSFPIMDTPLKRSPAESAKILRQFWKLPRGPIDNLTKILEDNGIIVISMDFGTDKIDGRSIVTSTGKFIIFINKNIPGDRGRLTLAHELAHVILHLYAPDVFEIDTETEAKVFASEFLMPENEIRPQLIGKLTIAKLADLKRYWKTSMQAILYWAEKLKTVTANQARYLWSQFYSLGIKIIEPIEVPFEKPSLLFEIVNSFIDHLGYSKPQLAELLNLYEADLVQYYSPDYGGLKVVR
jgi:Zn-dependent peptidase ImmA (M78 family)